MPLRRAVLTAALLMVAGAASPVLAEPGEIKGQDVLGDKTKSAQDGFSQSPVTREESPAKDAPNPGGPSTDGNAQQPGGEAPKPKSAGEEPQQPLEHRTPTPSGANPAQPSK